MINQNNSITGRTTVSYLFLLRNLKTQKSDLHFFWTVLHSKFSETQDYFKTDIKEKLLTIVSPLKIVKKQNKRVL